MKETRVDLKKNNLKTNHKNTVQLYKNKKNLHLLSFDVKVFWWVNILKWSRWPLEALVALGKPNNTSA